MAKGPRGEKRPADVIGTAIMMAKIAMGRHQGAVLLGLAALLSSGDAVAQQVCWQVASSNAPAGPSYVLVNQCTGQTWQLVKIKGTEQNGTVQPNEWVWTWQAIAMPATTNP